MSKSTEEQLFEKIDEVNDQTLVDIPENKQKPRIGEAGWSEWVLSHLTDDERDSKTQLPKTEGLGRLIPLLIGDIVESNSDPTYYLPVDDRGNFVAVVKHTLRVQTYGDNILKTFGAVGEASINNADQPYSKYPGSVASTRARGRTYRDSLMVKGCVFEEISKVAERSENLDPDDAGPIEHSQKAAIESVCRKNGIDVQKFINYGPFKHNSLDRIHKGTGRKMLSVLNGYQSGAKIPTEVLKEE